jgi:hypothetical protein
MRCLNEGFARREDASKVRVMFLANHPPSEQERNARRRQLQAHLDSLEQGIHNKADRDFIDSLEDSISPVHTGRRRLVCSGIIAASAVLHRTKATLRL